MLSSTPSHTTAGYFSRGIMRWQAVPELLHEYRHFVALGKTSRRQVGAVVGWGAKPSSERARHYAVKHGLPYIALEDGFIRSYGLGVEAEQPHSLVVDHTGIYYDATRPSDLEQLISDARFSDAELLRARDAMAQIRYHRLSKYNAAPDRLPRELVAGRRYVLVVDQTRGDASVALGMGSAECFNSMLEEALARHPDADILIKVHPDVASGHRRGYLAEGALPERCYRIDEALNPWALLEHVEAVHVVTSQLGFEALLAGCQVFCHGMPFYAGWGLTEDRQYCPRRKVKRSLEQVFTAAYLRYSRYYNPITRSATSLEETIYLLADIKRQTQRLSGRWAIHGMSGWKRRFIHQYLGPQAHIRYIKDSARGLHIAPDERVLVWGFNESDQLKAAYQQRGISPYRAEDGFVRSNGLGADLVHPLSLVIDANGLYYDPAQPSDLEHILQHHAFDESLIHRATALQKSLVELKLSKYNLGGASLPSLAALPKHKEVILVPGQVETDASVLRGSRSVTSNSELLRRVRERYPEAIILYKEHPDVVSKARRGALSADEHALYDINVSDANITDLLDRVDSVHTMSSLTGFEALLRNVRVHTWGMPFYAGWGLTEDEVELPRRKRRLSLEQLVAGALILYPCYVAPHSGQLCNIESVIQLIHQRASLQQRLTLKTRLWRLYRGVVEGQR
ncbi:capsule biosynthesis protein [Carnimonas nigrificans]|uniref:capsular polysaccharide export protein, LipB/KpsS family n=1 Tax=Carnimonas nigrificans TaxID=64323 RepID=UPI0004B7C699